MTDHLNPILAALTVEDICALRTADSVAWNVGPCEGDSRIRATTCTAYRRAQDFNGKATILTMAEQRAFDTVPGDGYHRTREIPCEGYLTSYVTRWPTVCPWKGWVQVDRHDSCWQTVARLLKKGDRLTVRLKADNVTGAVSDLGVSVDEAFIEIYRGDDDRNPALTFHLDTRVSQPHGQRMIIPR